MVCCRVSSRHEIHRANARGVVVLFCSLFLQRESPLSHQWGPSSELKKKKLRPRFDRVVVLRLIPCDASASYTLFHQLDFLTFQWVPQLPTISFSHSGRRQHLFNYDIMVGPIIYLENHTAWIFVFFFVFYKLVHFRFGSSDEQEQTIVTILRVTRLTI